MLFFWVKLSAPKLPSSLIWCSPSGLLYASTDSVEPPIRRHTSSRFWNSATVWVGLARLGTPGFAGYTPLLSGRRSKKLGVPDRTSHSDVLWLSLLVSPRSDSEWIRLAVTPSLTRSPSL